MAIAGRVAIVPKGEWSQSVTYDKLDLVTYNGNTFIAYKSSVGVEPVDGDTWMLVMQGIDPQDIENIIDGTIPVGDSNKLGGKGASEYVTKNIIKSATAVGWYRIAKYTCSQGDGYLGNTASSCNIIIKKSWNNVTPEIHRIIFDSGYSQFRFSSTSSFIPGYQTITKIRYVYSSSTKEGYIDIYTTSQNSLLYELDYVEDFRGVWETISPTLVEETVDGFTVGTTYELPKNAKPATSADLANYLPKTGGTLINETFGEALTINRPSGGAGIKFLAQNYVGYLGVDANGHPCYWNNYITSQYLLHTGNKPSGSYTGNGVDRSVQTGGLGECIMIRSNRGFIIVCAGSGGGIGNYHDGVSTTVKTLTYQETNFGGGGDGVLAINTSDPIINENGTVYIYQVL